MSEIVVTTQAELDDALAAADDTTIIIDSPDGVWIEVGDSSRVTAWGSSRVTARGSSRVTAWGSSRVDAWDSSRVDARGSSRVDARGSSRVTARGSSRVDARGSSRVTARGSSRVDAWDSSRVDARGSSRVDAWDSSRVDAWDSSRVTARGSSRVTARGSSRVDAWDSSRVDAGAHVAVHLHSQRVRLSGGVVIDLTDVNLDDVDTWVAWTGAAVDGGDLLLYKAVSPDLITGDEHGMPTGWAVGEPVEASDWNPARRCGNGLHMSPHPSLALDFRPEDEASRMLLVRVARADLVTLGSVKAKAPRCVVVREVDLDGSELAGVGDDARQNTGGAA